MHPEQLARRDIDKQLSECRWVVQNCRNMNITAGLGVAVRKVGLTTGDADYLLFVDGKAAGVLEAKSEGSSLTTAETQSQKYLSGLSARVPHYRLPLPFEYRADGKTTHFTDDLEPNARSRELFAFHRPEVLLRLVRLESQLRHNLRELPEFNTSGQWDVQVRAIINPEKFLADNKPQAFVQMATGSGKNFTSLRCRPVTAVTLYESGNSIRSTQNAQSLHAI